MKTQKISALFCAVALTCSVATGTRAASVQDWPQFLGSPATPGITQAKTPVNASAAELKWTAKRTVTSEYNGAKFESNAFGTPILVGDSLYVTVSDGKLLKLAASTGKTEASAPCNNIPPYFSQIAYGDGKIFVPQQFGNGVQISAFDAKTLAFLWQSDAVTFNEGAQQIASPLTYYEKHIYFGTYAQDASTYAYRSGVYTCLDADSGKAVWQQTNSAAGYYWNGAAILGSAVVIADTAGNITAYQRTNGTKISSVFAGGPIFSTLCSAEGRIYASVKSGYVYSVKADSNGNLYGSTAVKSAVLGNSISSSPVVYNSRLYVAGGGFGATTPFSVLDAATLKTVYQIKEIQSQSSALVTTAYANDKNQKQVCIYLTKYGAANQDGVFAKDSSSVYVIRDKAGQTKASYETLFTPSSAQSCTQSLAASKDGMLYYFNDSGTLYAVGSKSPLTSPKTGEASVAGGVVLFILSGATVILAKKRMK